ncbi:MAG: VTT domain-containing protein [Clostridia bacterium]|nr:VTT domain-containing protein [Clostridia bacterium]
MLRQKLKNEKFVLKVFMVLGVVCFIAATALIVLSIVMSIDSVRMRYDQYLDVIRELEVTVTELENHKLIAVVILLLYILRSLTPAYPYNALYIITGMVYRPHVSLTLNFIGMLFNVVFRYYTGQQMGEGYINRVLRRYPTINSAFEVDGRGNPIVLFALRFVPIFPFNTVSQLYGSIEYPFVKYTVFSMLALLPRLITYSYIGSNVYDPLSPRFYTPLIVLFIFTGISFFFMRGVLGITLQINKRSKRIKRKDINANEPEPDQNAIAGGQL